jgi:hypothetical protein
MKIEFEIAGEYFVPQIKLKNLFEKRNFFQASNKLLINVTRLL